MASIAGRKAKVYWSDNGTDWSQIQGIDSVGDNIAAAPINDNEFGVEWNQFVSGILSNKFTLTGGLRVGDTNGQVAMKAAMIAGDFGYFKILWDGTTNGYSQQVLVSKFAVDTKVSDKSNLSVDLDANGAPTAIP